MLLQEVPTNYHFTYHVSDQYSGDTHHHEESRTQEGTAGQYSVKLPDGRTQVRGPVCTVECLYKVVMFRL